VAGILENIPWTWVDLGSLACGHSCPLCFRTASDKVRLLPYPTQCRYFSLVGTRARGVQTLRFRLLNGASRRLASLLLVTDGCALACLEA